MELGHKAPAYEAYAESVISHSSGLPFFHSATSDSRLRASASSRPFLYPLLDDSAPDRIPGDLATLLIRAGRHVTLNGFLETTLHIAACVPAVPDHIHPLRDVEVIRRDAPSPSIGVEQAPAGEILFRR